MKWFVIAVVSVQILSLIGLVRRLGSGVYPVKVELTPGIDSVRALVHLVWAIVGLIVLMW